MCSSAASEAAFCVEVGDEKPEVLGMHYVRVCPIGSECVKVEMFG